LGWSASLTRMLLPRGDGGGGACEHKRKEAIEAHLQALREEGREIPGGGEVLLARVEV